MVPPGPMAVPTKQELLDAIDEAIMARLLGGAVAAYTILGKNIQLAPLDELRRLRADIAQQAIDEDADGVVYVADLGDR